MRRAARPKATNRRCRLFCRLRYLGVLLTAGFLNGGGRTPVQEALLQFIWQYSLYSPTGLSTTDGTPITVVHPGRLNRDAGPDFAAARIRINNALLVGDVELHIRSSDWVRHRHSTDRAYDKIILHVVMDDDAPGVAGAVPVLSLRSAVPPEVISRYTSLLHTTRPIPCEAVHGRVSALTKTAWLERVLAERWARKLKGWEVDLERCGGDWLSVLYCRLMAALAGNVNAQPMEAVAHSVPLSVLRHYAAQPLQLEALFFGQARMLSAREGEEPRDEHWQWLRKEYDYLRQKHSLEQPQPQGWKFARMRPAAFPTLRLAQAAALMAKVAPALPLLLEGGSIRSLLELFDVSATTYWNNHFRFGEPHAKPAGKTIGRTTADLLLVNVVAPLRFLYGTAQGRPGAHESALSLLSGLPAEDNNIIRQWRSIGWAPTHAAGSQALLELFSQYCAPKRCLECAVGLAVIRSNGPVK